MEQNEYLVTLDDGETEFINAYDLDEACRLADEKFGRRVFHVELNQL